MPLDDEALDRLQELAALRLSPEERTKLREDLRRILDYVRHLQAVDVDDVPPTSSVREDLSGHNPSALRADRAEPGLGTERALSNAPARYEDWFDLPGVRGLGEEA
jgi:aspartyl-tRNA(Asn)/glutamyl-tRNA(Gln) amidotransferase subunit C